jgi:hypothetical protein
MGWVFALVQRGRVAMQRIDEVLSVRPSIADRATRARRAPARRDRVPPPLVPLRRRPRGGAARRVPARARRQRARRGGPDRLGQDHAGVADPAPVRGARRAALPRRRRREPHPAAHAALVDRDGAAGRLPVLDDAGRERGLRAAGDGPRRGARGGARAQLAKDVEDLPHGWDTLVGRARRHALRRPAPAHHARPRPGAATRAS